jgi:hypothetical protein
MNKCISQNNEEQRVNPSQGRPHTGVRVLYICWLSEVKLNLHYCANMRYYVRNIKAICCVVVLISLIRSGQIFRKSV